MLASLLNTADVAGQTARPAPAGQTQFSEEPRAIWLTDIKNGDRRMKLLGDFWYIDRANVRWLTPANYTVDGASIPRALWTLVGSPYTGCYRRASIVHDKACDDAVGSSSKRRAADRMFYEACRTGGCSVPYSTILYLGVRIGAARNAVNAWRDDAPSEHEQSWRTTFTPAEQRIQADFRLIAEQILRQPTTDDPVEIERRVDEAVAAIVGVNLRAQ
jgi:hypothetical protein